MTTLQEVGFTLAGGSCVMVVSWALFGWAVRVQSPLIAPRAIARPKQVICGNIPGNAWTGWIGWTLGLSYNTLLEGIPGTGTRSNGHCGSLLKVNLDGIVLLRFHAVCLRVSLLAAVIFVLVLIPVYLSAQCFDVSECEDQTYNLTNYQRTTLANIPAYVEESLDLTSQGPGSFWRLYAIVISFWIVASYLCHELQQEWAQILAMRRVYYLEYDIWGERRNELKETLLQDDTSMKERHLFERDPWVPHPEQRDTVPNIALYSILVGGLPSLPEQAADSFNAEATIQFSKRESIDWQLSLTTTFFDHCVPNQPGFSSSVAAVTIIPSAMDLSIAWRKWYTAASKLRRLRFIRQQIANKLHYDIDDVNDLEDEQMDPVGPEVKKFLKSDKTVEDPTDYGYDDDVLRYGYETHEPNTTAKARTVGFATDDHDMISQKSTHDTGNPPGPDVHTWKTHRPEDDDVSDNFNIYASSDFGPEQAAVYAREFAQSAAPCCPVGCNEGRLRRAGIDHLKKLERITAMEVHEANLELRAARRRATRADTNHCHDHVLPKTETIQAQSCVQLGDLETSGGPTATTPMSETLSRPMTSRYDRKSSMGNAEQAVKEDREKRLNQLNDIVTGDLGLEAQLFKKNTDTAVTRPPIRGGTASTRNSFTGTTTSSSVATNKKEFLSNSQRSFQVNGLVGPSAGTDPLQKTSSLSPPTRIKPHRRTPSTDGVALPRDIALEAQLVQESSHHSSSASHRGKPSNRRLSYIRETRDSTVSSASITKSTIAKESAPLHPLKTDFDDTTSAHWAQVESIVTEAKAMNQRTTPGFVPNGAWSFTGLRGFFQQTKKKGKGIKQWAQQQSKEAVVTLARESTYAVLTFTSRQAAVAARSCLADGRGAGRWVTLKEIPIPPLSDAAPGDLVTFRNCCRPVTLSINERQKSIRNYCAMMLLGAMYIFYTLPLTAATALLDPQEFAAIIPAAADIEERDRYEIANLLAGLTSALIWSTFFALCPLLFKGIAHFGSKATSVANAEFKALQYYWWFMVLTAFSGQLLTQVGLKTARALGDTSGVDVANDFQAVVRTIARTIPSTVSISWLNWIIFRVTVILPLNYLLQANSFIFNVLGLNCCSRLVRGGGPGGPVPYRLYVDSGVVLMCVFSLAPASPIVALGSALYFLFCQPVLRRNLIFMYRPKVPVCLAGTDTDEFLTAEPAIVVPTETDDIEDTYSMGGSSAMVTESPEEAEWIRQSTRSTVPQPVERRKTQHGVTLRRAVKPIAARKRTGSVESNFFEMLDEDERSGISPFERSMSCRSVLGQPLHGALQRVSCRSRTSSGSDEDKLRSRRPRSNTANTPPGLVKPGLIQPVSLRGRRASLLGSIPQIHSLAKTHNKFQFDLHRPDYYANNSKDDASFCPSHHSGGTNVGTEDDVQSHESRSKYQ